MKKHYLPVILAVATSVFTACDDSTDTIGKSIVPTADSINTKTREFAVTSKSVKANSVVSRSRYAYMGKIKDYETDTYFTANFMTQVAPVVTNLFPSLVDMYAGDEYLGKTSLTDEEYKAKLEALINREEVTATFNVLYDTFFGDSLANMKMMVHEMSEPYLESKTYYTDFNPMEQGMVRTNGGIHADVAYAAANQAEPTGTYARYSVQVPLNKPYTDPHEGHACGGRVFKNYGAYLIYHYYSKDAYGNSNFSNSVAFRKNICPGFYVENTGGIGSVASVATTMVQVMAKARNTENGKDTLDYRLSVFSGTEEQMQMTNIVKDDDAIAKLCEDESCTYIKAPAAIFTQLELPVDSIMDGHDNDTLSTARIFVPRLNNHESSSLYSFATPSYLLMLPVDSVKTFFENNQLADSKMSYLSSFSSGMVNGYVFSNISTLVTHLYYNKKNSGLTDEEYAQQHPDWNKVMLVPVEVTTSTSTSSSTSTITKICHQMSLASTRLATGTNSADSPIKVSVIYSTFKKD